MTEKHFEKGQVGSVCEYCGKTVFKIGPSVPVNNRRKTSGVFYNEQWFNQFDERKIALQQILWQEWGGRA